MVEDPIAGADASDLQAVLVDVGAVLAVGRYHRIETVARRLGWDPALVLDHAVGAVVLPPESGVVQDPDAHGARARADRGQASWAEAMAELAAAVDAGPGPDWDEGAYWSALREVPVTVDLGPGLERMCGASRPVGLLVQGPAEFVAGVEQRLPGGTPLWHSSSLGQSKPEAWLTMCEDMALNDPAQVLVVDDAWASQQAMAERGFRTLQLDAAGALAQWERLVDAWTSLPPDCDINH